MLEQLQSMTTSGTKDATVNLAEYIDVNKCSVLNNNSTTYVSSILKSEGVLKSDADTEPQLLLFVPFLEAVKIRSIAFHTSKELKSEKESGPRIVKLFVDNTTLDFSDADSAKPTQTFTLKSEELDGRDIATKFVNFQNVHSLAIFIESNQKKTDVTTINRMGFAGETCAGMNMKDLKKSG